MSEGFSNNATPKYLGYIYQVLIAIEKCFEAKSNETIWIECYGDVYDGKTFTEVKHHCTEHNLSSNSQDFWKTLKNLVVEDSSLFQKIVLHTTSYISENSAFHGWNDLSAKRKLEIVKSHVPTSSTKSFYDTIFREASDTEIENILSRFTIEHSQLQIEEKWKSLLEIRNLKCVAEPYRESILDWVYSYVNKRAIADNRLWRVNINDFDDAFQFQVNRWSGDKIPFPVDNRKYDLSPTTDYLFITEYKDIGLKAQDRGNAVNDYFKAKNSEEMLVDLKPDVMPEILIDYSRDVVEQAKGYKSERAYDIEFDDLDTTKSREASRNAYLKFHNSSVLEVPEIANTKAYFMRGKLHEAINDKSYTWKYEQEDLD